MNRCAVVAMMVLSTICLADEKEGWEVHDRKRPQPPVVAPAEPSTQEKAGKPPSDAAVLFDGSSLSKWQGADGNEAKWKVENEYLETAKGTGNIQTKQEFGDVQLHVEWMTPAGTEGKDQHRGNSGVFLMGQYEIQVLDNHGSETYPDGTAGGAYGQYPPQANALRPQGQWQFYDIVFHPPVYEGEKVAKPARATAFVNGVLTLDDVALLGPTKHGELASYPPTHPKTGPVALQDHGAPVRFRNIWVRELKEAPVPPVRAAKEAH
jgi:hypothetical protein